MTHSLKNLAHIALAEVLAGETWDKQELQQGHFYSPPVELVKKVFQRVETLGLPNRLEWEQKAVMLEFGERKHIKLYLKDAMERAGLNKSSSDDEWSRPLFFHIAPKMMDAPYFCRHFPEEHDRKLAIELSYLLFLPNPRLSDNLGAIRKLWTSPAFVPLQSIFLKKAFTIWHFFKKNLVVQLREESSEAAVSGKAMMTTWMTFYITLPWFVFDVLSDNQRNVFLQAGETTYNVVCDAVFLFKYHIASIFIRWPWQDKALNYLMTKEELLYYDLLILDRILNCKESQERVEGDVGILPKGISVYWKVKKFCNDRLKEKPWVYY